MSFGHNPGFIRTTWGIRVEGNELLIVDYDSLAPLQFLGNYVTVKTPVFIDVIIMGNIESSVVVRGYYRRSHYLGVGVGQGCP